ncbi:MAG: hypothetical protein JXA06_07710 [Bacteroidetes bacterium]|nr:hypothetical protein [Bacteroidota bacterium]
MKIIFKFSLTRLLLVFFCGIVIGIDIALLAINSGDTVAVIGVIFVQVMIAVYIAVNSLERKEKTNTQGEL